MILSVNDFALDSGGNYFYTPKLHILETSYYNEVHNEFYENNNDCLESTNWIFQVDKEEVFNELGWQPFEFEDTHLNSLDGSFPEFENQDQATLFLITAILLHNEKIQH